MEQICFKLDGFRRSEWVPLSSSGRRRRLQLRDDRGPNQGHSLSLLLEVSRRGLFAVSATLSVEFWLENLSGLPLVYGEPVKVAVETLAGPVTSEVVLTPMQVGPPTTDQPQAAARQLRCDSSARL